jgi:hypothetical protein
MQSASARLKEILTGVGAEKRSCSRLLVEPGGAIRAEGQCLDLLWSAPLALLSGRWVGILDGLSLILAGRTLGVEQRIAHRVSLDVPHDACVSSLPSHPILLGCVQPAPPECGGSRCGKFLFFF